MASITHNAMSSKASLALMKFLSDLSRRLGVGQHVYVVGGAVRNFLIRRPIKDIDVVIDSVALEGKDSEWFAKEVMKAIPARVNYETNKYGVALLHVVSDWILAGENLKGEEIEIANARTESYTDGGWKPDEVEKATIVDDMYRREFTFNTLLWRMHDLANGPDKAEILDITGCGLRDLEEGVMRCPSSPDKTFSDDPSRMIRAVKFLVKYGFKIPLDVRRSIGKNKAKIRNIPDAALSNMLINTFLRDPSGKQALIEMQKLGLLDEVKDIARTNKSFRNALAGWADREAKVEFLFDLMDMGMPSGKRLSFLDRYQLDRVREVTVGLPADAADQYVRVLQQPGKVMDTRVLMQEFDLKGPALRRVTDQARRYLMEDPSLAADGWRLTQRIKEDLAEGKTAAEKGDASKVALMLRLPDHIASQFPDLDEDDSPAHCTFLHVGTVAGRETELLNLIQAEVASVSGPVRASLDGLDYFIHPERQRAVAYCKVRFSGYMDQLRDRIRTRLADAGFDIADMSPLVYVPHVTLAYLPSLDAIFEGEVPTGSWLVDEIEVWGLPSVGRIKIAVRKDRLPGGLGDKKKPSDFDPKAVALGVKIEMEHTSDPAIAREIALDHLTEDPNYYNKLETIEKHSGHRGDIYGKKGKKFELNIGDPLLMGKYLNSPGRIEEFGQTDKGDPTVIVRKTPKGDKGQGAKKEVKLFKVRFDEEQAEKDKAQKEADRVFCAEMHTLQFDAGSLGITKRVPKDSLPLLFNSAFADAVSVSQETETVIPMALLGEGKTAGRFGPDTHLKQATEVLGSWDRDAWAAEFEAAARANYEALSREAAKFKDKKEVPKADGKGTTTVYEYSEGQVQHRNREKAKKVEKLRGSIDKLRAQVKKDLKSKDEKTRMQALCVGLMDETYERVGNDESAKDGHFGVTGWKVKHLTFSGGKATLKYVGKSGVSHSKVVSDKALVAALKEAAEDKGENDSLTGSVGAAEVNEYLKPFGVTAKDVRGYHANAEVQSRLKAIRSQGGKLPEDKKEREKKLKKEFQQALDEAAKAVGHEPSTLRSQYLVPGVEDNFLRDGSVKEKLDRQGHQVVALAEAVIRDLVATKTEGEKEEEEVERLQRPNPKKKPPRKDLRRNRMKPDDDDTKSGVEGDRDLSLNYKKVGALADEVIRCLTAASVERVPIPKRKPGDVWQASSGSWVGMNPKGNTHTFGNDDKAKEQAQAFAKGLADTAEDTDAVVDEQEKKKKQEKAKQEREKFKTDAQALLESVDMPDEVRAEIETQIGSKSTDLARAYREAEKTMRERLREGVTVDLMKGVKRDPFKGIDTSDPSQLATAMVNALVRDRLLLDPTNVGGKPLSSVEMTSEERAARAIEAMKQYRHVSKAQRAKASDDAAKALMDMDPESPEARELNAIIDGLHAAAVIHDEPFEATDADGKLLREPLNPKLQSVARAMISKGQSKWLFLDDPTKLYEAEGREAVRDALGAMDDASLIDLAKDTPWEPLANVLDNFDLSPDVEKYLRGMMLDMSVNAMTTVQGVAAAIARRSQDSATPVSLYDKIADDLNETTKKSTGDVVQGILDDCLSADDVVACLTEKRDQLLRAQAQGVVEYLDKLDSDNQPDPRDVSVALARAIAGGADPGIADEAWEKEKPVEERRREFLQNLSDPKERDRVREMSADEFATMEKFFLSGEDDA